MTWQDIHKRLKARPSLWSDFVEREWFTVFIWCGLGALAAGLLRLAAFDHTFQVFLATKYLPNSKVLEDPQRYLPYGLTAGAAVFIAILLGIPRAIVRGMKSWWLGVTSGLALLSFASTFALLALSAPALAYRLILVPVILVVSFLASWALFLIAVLRAQDTPSEDNLRVSSVARSLVGTQIAESDDPIRTWGEDALGRASLVDSISVKIMISKSPVLGLFGEFGSGKTSILNLLREHLGDKAIIVSFSTWLPGSQETLTSYLLSDIANECQKAYLVPGLRRSAQRLAKALGQNVPLVRNYLESLPAATQRDDIENLKRALARLPKRVVVLLDELDRMEEGELITLLKVIRGVSTLPNLSFVCAGHREMMAEIIHKDIFYFEKFFPVSIQIPTIDPAALRNAGTKRLSAALERRSWFDNEPEIEAFRKKIDAIWDELIAPFCRNLRAIGLLANNVGTAAAPLRREVDPVDLTLMEVLRTFKPKVYEIIGKNSVVLTGGPGLRHGSVFYTEKDKERMGKELLEDLRQATLGADGLDVVKKILAELFPDFRDVGDASWTSFPSYRRSSQSEPDEKDSKHIRHPEIFPAYFRYELPEAIFSSVEMDSFLRKLSEAIKSGGAENAFQAALDSMEKGSPKRDDFLRKLADAAQTSMPLATGQALVHAAVKSAHKYTYDMLAAFGEAGHVLRVVLRIAQRMSKSDRLKLLEDCIVEATDDTMALNILTKLTVKQAELDLDVSLAQLYPAFRKRMRQRYGRDVDASKVDLSTSDPWAFNYWGHTHKDTAITFDPEDRSIQRDFWLGHIGNNRSRLAQDFRGFFMPANVAYSGDLEEFVENKIPVADLKLLYEQLPEDPALSEIDRQSLKTLRRLLAGDFKNGVPFRGPCSDDDTEETKDQEA